MKKIFIHSLSLKINGNVYVRDQEYHHLAHVLRVKINDCLIVGDKDGNEYYGRIIGIDKNKLTILIVKEYTRKKINLDLTLFFSVLKGNKNEFLIQKCTEIGVNKFVPVITKNSIVKIIEKKEKKINRWQNIAKEAAMQSLRERIPKICNLIFFEDLKNYDINGAKYFGFINEKNKKTGNIINNLDKNLLLSFFSGPEGDFDKKEINFLLNSGWEGINLNPNILRSETSAIYFASSIFSYFWK